MFKVEQVLALFLKKVREFYDNEDISTVILTVPSYYTYVERQALINAVEIAGMTCARVINESRALVLNYGFFKRQEFHKKKRRTVCFVDFGHSKTTVTIARFLPKAAKVTYHHSDRNLGARDFDYLIMETLAKEFADKNGCDP